VIGVDVPVELVVAAGFDPLPVLADINDRRAEAILDESQGQPRVRALLSRLLTDDRPPVRRLLIGSTPSYLAVLYQVLRHLPRFRPDLPRYDVHLVDIQHGRLDASASYNLAKLSEARSVLEGWSGIAISDDAIEAAIESTQAIRDRAAGIERSRIAGKCSGAEALRYYLSAARQSGDAEGAPFTSTSQPSEAAVPIVYSGMAAGPDLYESIEKAGFRIVADDQEMGASLLGQGAAGPGTPLERLARAYAFRFPSPARSTIEDRTAALLAMVRRAGAAAVLFNIPAFEHPAAWDQPAIRGALEAAGIACFELDPRAYERPELLPGQLAALRTGLGI
jgi:benzoyl-CoA reductase/2-hydroxyglutaryl-CoA dehydratase subunit BcrC/BadD/HgdB